jgi:thioredoxin 1
MNTTAKIGIILAVAAAAAAAVVLKQNRSTAAADRVTPAIAAAGSTADGPGVGTAPAVLAQLPRLVDLGADQCIPCKAMAPILEELRKEHAGKMEVEFIDVWKNPDAGKAYGIELIPTQIFYDARGKELFRHQGFFGKEDILGKWKELGVDLGERK